VASVTAAVTMPAAMRETWRQRRHSFCDGRKPARRLKTPITIDFACAFGDFSAALRQFCALRGWMKSTTEHSVFAK
jgi:hypothetical protein